jgi:hypothetical protein
MIISPLACHTPPRSLLASGHGTATAADTRDQSACWNLSSWIPNELARRSIVGHSDEGIINIRGLSSYFFHLHQFLLLFFFSNSYFKFNGIHGCSGRLEPPNPTVGSVTDWVVGHTLSSHSFGYCNVRRVEVGRSRGVCGIHHFASFN